MAIRRPPAQSCDTLDRFAYVRDDASFGRSGPYSNLLGTWENPMRQLFSAILLFLVGLTPASADVRIEASSGGEVTSFLGFFALLRQSGERVVIDGPCFSACTLVLSTIPRNRICVTRRAVLGFHAPKLVDQYGGEYPAGNATRLMAATYPPPIRNWIKRHGGLTKLPIFLSGRELGMVYPLCG